jgi:hypothetical protein
MEDVGLFYGHLVFCGFDGHLVHFSPRKNLATLHENTHGGKIQLKKGRRERAQKY